MARVIYTENAEATENTDKKKNKKKKTISEAEKLLLLKDDATRKNPRVSVLLPVYNTEKYLEQCLDSVINQTLKSIEIICVNDGSTDGSLEILHEYSKKDSRIVIVDLPQNEGLARARHHGIKAATGDYCMFLDSDDFLEPEACETAYCEIATRKCDIFHFNTNVYPDGVFDPSALKSMEAYLQPYDGKIKGRKVFFACYSHHQFAWNLWNKIYKTSLLKKVFEFIPKERCIVGEDMFIFSMISFFARSYEGDRDTYLYNYRYGNGVSTKAVVSYKQFCSKLNHTVALNNMENFFRSQKAWDGVPSQFVENNKKNLLNDAVWFFMNTVFDEDAPKCFDLIAKLFDYEDVLEVLVYRNDLYKLGSRLAGCEFLKTEQKEIKNIGLFYHRYGNGGVERVMNRLIPILMSLGYGVTLIVEQETKYDFPLPKGCNKVIVANTINISRDEYLQHHLQLRKVLRQFKIDMLLYQASNSPHMLFDILAAKKENCYFVATTHDWITSQLLYDFRQAAWKSQVLKCCDCVQTITKTEEEIYANYGIKTRYIPNPLTFDHVTPPPMHEGAPNILWVGRLDYMQKDPLAPLYVMEEIRKFMPKATLTMLGKGESKYTDQEIDGAIAQRDLEECVNRVGFTKTPEKYYSNADVLLMTSSYECYPMVIGEAMSYGLPIVTYSMPYVEFFKNNPAVISVPQRNVFLTAHTLIDLLQDTEKRKHMRQCALERVAELEKEDITGMWASLIGDLSNDKIKANIQSENLNIYLETVAWNQYVCSNPIPPEKFSVKKNLKLYIKKHGFGAALRNILRYIRKHGLRAAINKGRYTRY